MATLTAGAAAQADPVSGIVKGYTEPSKRAEINFPSVGVVEEVAVKEGQLVKSGQILMVQDDDVESSELERLRLEADSTARLEYAEADRDYRRQVFERKSKAEGGVFSTVEIEEARLDMIKSDKQIEVTQLDQDGNKIRARQQAYRVEKMRLRSPFDGFVERIKNWEGELATPDRDKPAIILVQNDPAQVVIRELTTRQVAQLKLGETMEVRYPGETEWRLGKLIMIAPVADAASDTQLVKLEIPNPQNRATGLPVEVKLPAKLGAAGSEKTAQR